MNSTTPVSLGRALGLGTVLILLFEAVAIFAGAKFGSFATFFILLFGGFVTAGLASRWIASWAGVAGIIGFLAGTILSYSAQPLALLLTGQKSSLGYSISVNRAPEYNVPLFEFTDGTVQAQYTGYYSTRGRTMKSPTGGSGHEYINEIVVAPLVDANWTKAEPVPVWVVCQDSWDPTNDVSDTDTCRRHWSTNVRTGVKPDESDSRDIKTAITNAATKHALTTHPNAVFVVLTPEAALTVSGAKGLGVAILVLAHVSYAIAVIAKRKTF